MSDNNNCESMKGIDYDKLRDLNCSHKKMIDDLKKTIKESNLIIGSQGKEIMLMKKAIAEFQEVKNKDNILIKNQGESIMQKNQQIIELNKQLLHDASVDELGANQKDEEISELRQKVVECSCPNFESTSKELFIKLVTRVVSPEDKLKSIEQANSYLRFLNDKITEHEERIDVLNVLNKNQVESIMQKNQQIISLKGSLNFNEKVSAQLAAQSNKSEEQMEKFSDEFNNRRDTIDKHGTTVENKNKEIKQLQDLVVTTNNEMKTLQERLNEVGKGSPLGTIEYINSLCQAQKELIDSQRETITLLKQQKVE